MPLIADEYRVRQRWGDQLGREAYQRRFPGQAEQLEAAMDSIDQRGAAARYKRGLHIRCPHCQNAIELVDDAPLSDVACPSCGSSFSLVGDATTTWGAVTGGMAVDSQAPALSRPNYVARNRGPR